MPSINADFPGMRKREKRYPATVAGTTVIRLAATFTIRLFLK